MAEDERRKLMADASEQIKAIRRLQSEMKALTQKIQTSLVAYRPEVEDWEDRYVREGFLEVEGYANGEST